MQWILVFLGGGLGAAMRHGVNLAAPRLLGTAFPFGTLAINVVGSLLMGVVAGWLVLRGDPSPAWRLFLATGVLGGFTTFSAFSLEAVQLWQRGQAGLAALYVGGSVLLSIAALWLGLALVRPSA